MADTASTFSVESFNATTANHPVAASFGPAIAALLPKHAEAVALVEATNGDNVKALATSQWEASDTPEAKRYRELQTAISEAMAKIQPVIDKANELRDAAIPAFTESAMAYAAEHGADAKKNELATRNAIVGLLAQIRQLDPTVGEFAPLAKPRVKGGTNGKGTRGRKAGMLNWALANESRLDGAEISHTGDNPTLGDVAKSVGVSRESLDLVLRAAANGHDELAVGKSVTLTFSVNDNSHELKAVGRATAKRGRKAKSATPVVTNELGVIQPVNGATE